MGYCTTFQNNRLLFVLCRQHDLQSIVSLWDSFISLIQRFLFLIRPDSVDNKLKIGYLEDELWVVLQLCQEAFVVGLRRLHCVQHLDHIDIFFMRD